jgi:trimeric autotransporter adhesin
MNLHAAAIVAGIVLAASADPPTGASELSGRVRFSGVAVPGAVVSATQGDRIVSTVTDDAGTFRFASLEDGAWQLRIEMRGFVTVAHEVPLPYSGPPLAWDLTMQSYAEIVGTRPPAVAASQDAPDTADAEVKTDAPLDVDVINGSVNNGAATPFAQSPAFGNNRQLARSKYSGAVSAVLGNSAWNARPFSFGGASATPSYGDLQIGLTLLGPLKIPRLVRNGPQLAVSYQHGVVHSATTQSALMPTAAERAGDLSAASAPIRDPLTGLPFAGNVIPASRISPQAAALLGYYPLPNGATTRGANYQKAVVTATTQDILQLGTTKSLTNRTTLGGTFAYQRATTDTKGLFEFLDSSRQSTVDAAMNWSRRFSTRLSVRARHQFARTASNVTPFFARRTNVSGDAGVSGNSQDPSNWGPPSLSFPDVAGLRDADYQQSVNQKHATGVEASVKRGRHNITFGGDLRRNGFDVSSQPDPRGTLGFTGAASGNAFADFLLGIPTTSAIGFGDGVTRLRGAAHDAYVTDDWRVSSLTLNLGARWEYESPFTASGLRPDRRGLEPRLAASWRPVAGSSLVIRGSYGIYRNLGVYQPLGLLLAQQPPFSRTLSVQNSALTPLTLANPFPSALPSARTFAVDPGFRVGYAQTWQVSAQRDLPGSLTMITTYLGAKGSHLMQASLPNTYPAGALNPCPACPTGFISVTSDGRSLRNAAQFTLRRRLHNGLMMSGQYTIAKSTDDAATFSNAAVSPRSLSIAQDWLNLAAELGPSPFDQRHVLSVQFQYTSGVGVAGGTLVDSAWGTLFKDWTIGAQLTAGSGLPFTPVSFLAVAGTGFVGVRPRLTGVSPEPVANGSYANPAAYSAPAPGEWGNAGRNSIRGPGQAALDASVSRVFRLRGRLNFEWRVAATNVLNRVTFAAINTVIASPQFGLPTLANPMRRLQATLRLRF